MSNGPAFEVTVRSVVVTVAGEVDVATAPELDKALQGVLEGGGTRLVVDLADVTFLDSSGISALVRAAHSAREEGRSFAVRNPRSNVRLIFEITGLNEVLGVEPTG